MTTEEQGKTAEKAAEKWANKNLNNLPSHSFNAKLRLLTDFAKDFIKELKQQ